MAPVTPELYDLLDAGIASLLDPAPIRFRPADERGVRLFAGRRVRAYVAASGYVREFRTPKLLGLLKSAATRTARC